MTGPRADPPNTGSKAFAMMGCNSKSSKALQPIMREQRSRKGVRDPYDIHCRRELIDRRGSLPQVNTAIVRAQLNQRTTTANIALKAMFLVFGIL